MAMVAPGLGLALLAAALALHPARAAGEPVLLSGASPAGPESAALALTGAAPAHLPHRAGPANFAGVHASSEARHVADWVVVSGDNNGLPYAIVDKVSAKVFVFDAGGRLRGAAAALLGLARGDDSVPGIGTRKLSSILPEERTTPSGRFVASLDRSLSGDLILWVDYDSGVALHRVSANVPKERRLQRLESPLPSEHRITYGCINVPGAFYDNVVIPAFTGTSGIVYVLPETRSSRDVFGSYDVPPRTLPVDLELVRK